RAQRAHEPPVAKLVFGAGERPLESQALEPSLLRGERVDGGLRDRPARDRALRHGPARIGERQDRRVRAPAVLPSTPRSRTAPAPGGGVAPRRARRAGERSAAPRRARAGAARPRTRAATVLRAGAAPAPAGRARASPRARQRRVCAASGRGSRASGGASGSLL